jgi:hypothetical protein
MRLETSCLADVVGLAGLPAGSWKAKSELIKLNNPFTGRGRCYALYNSRTDAEPAPLAYAEVAGKLVPIAADDFLYGPSLLFLPGVSRNPRQRLQMMVGLLD